MPSKMNNVQKKVSKEIRAFCKQYAYKAQFDFKLCLTGHKDCYGRTLCLCESGVVTVCVGATIDNWREFPTDTLRRLLKGAKKEVTKRPTLEAVND